MAARASAAEVPLAGDEERLLIEAAYTGIAPAETARLLKMAFSAATMAAEKRTVLSIAQRLVCAESLELARAALKDSEVQAEAQLATDALERALSFLKK